MTDRRDHICYAPKKDRKTTKVHFVLYWEVHISELESRNYDDMCIQIPLVRSR